jgi:hypothetical protein
MGNGRRPPGNYVEFWADGMLRVFDRNGSLLSFVTITRDPPTLQPAENRITLRAAVGTSVKFTCITTGDPLFW